MRDVVLRALDLALAVGTLHRPHTSLVGIAVLVEQDFHIRVVLFDLLGAEQRNPCHADKETVAQIGDFRVWLLLRCANFLSLRAKKSATVGQSLLARTNKFLA
jgi:hypothetical protein